MLSKVSPVFENMFTLPTGDAEEKFEGVPLVHMPECAEELESLLKVLYHERYVNPLMVYFHLSEYQRQRITLQTP
jgi:hypothetical protein